MSFNTLECKMSIVKCKTIRMAMENKRQISGIELALLTVGGPERTRRTRLAKKLGVTRQAVFIWCKKGEIPVTQVKKVSDVLKLPPHLLNSLFAER